MKMGGHPGPPRDSNLQVWVKGGWRRGGLQEEGTAAASGEAGAELEPPGRSRASEAIPGRRGDGKEPPLRQSHSLHMYQHL